MNSLIEYIKEAYKELKFKVTWPTLGELQNSTVVVLIASLIIAIIIALMDQASRFSLDNFYGLF